MARAEIVLPVSMDTQEAVRSHLEIAGRAMEFAIVFGDITQVKADAIVCPSNDRFEYVGMGEVAGAVYRAAGAVPFEEAAQKAAEAIQKGDGVHWKDGSVGLPVGYALSTSAGRLAQIQSIIHVNNLRVDTKPLCDGKVVQSCTEHALTEADNRGFAHIATPALGTGLWAVSLRDSLLGTVRGLRDFTQHTNNPNVHKLSFVMYERSTFLLAKALRDSLETDIFPMVLGT